MKVLVVGGAGKVGNILRPGLEAEHELHVFDLQKVEGLDGRSVVGDVSDDEAVERAVAEMDAIVYLAMGVHPDADVTVRDIDLAFNINVRGTYRFLQAGLEAGARRFIYASSLSVYEHLRTRPTPVDEAVTPDAWDPYGITKRLAERLCEAAAMRHPDAVIIALRLSHPMTRERFERVRPHYPDRPMLATGPEDLRSLFLAALACTQPGIHIVQTSSDVKAKGFPNTRATQLLGWRPKGR